MRAALGLTHLSHLELLVQLRLVRQQALRLSLGSGLRLRELLGGCRRRLLRGLQLLRRLLAR
jgi:hypothetical protein